MWSQKIMGFRRLAACCVAAFVILIASSSTFATNNPKALNKGLKALKKGEFPAAEKIFRDLLNKDAHDNDARLALSFTP